MGWPEDECAVLRDSGPGKSGMNDAIELSFFSFVRRDHPFRPLIDQALETLHESECYSRLRDVVGRAATSVHAEIKGVWTADGRWKADRFYWCLQYWDPSKERFPFRAFTIYFISRNGKPEIYEFPRDPYLTTMPALLDPVAETFAGIGRAVKILRYVPLRRVTFLLGASAGQGPVIGKFKRRSKLKDSYDRLSAVYRAVRGSGAEFSVAAPMGIDEERCVFFQELLPGLDLNESMNEGNCGERLRRLGRLHRQMHALDVPGLPQWRFSDYLETLDSDIRWIGFYFPEHEAPLAEVWRRLRRSCPSMDDDNEAFCHGDFVPSQALADGGAWAITDFDMARRGGAVLEIAKVVASLKYDVPPVQRAFERTEGEDDALLASAEEAYLLGYEEEQGRRVDPERLRWFRTCAEIHYVSLMLKKDTFQPTTFERALALVHRLSTQFR